MTNFFHENIMWILPFMIFFARVLDVSIGTTRIIFLNRGLRLLAPICGFFEVFVWVTVMGAVMHSVNSWINYIAYAGGFAMGNYTGLLIENWLAVGLQSLWIVTREDKSDLLSHIREGRYGVTMLEARGAQGNVKILIMIIRRKNQKAVMKLLREHIPDAFVSVHDIRSVSGGVFPNKMVGPIPQFSFEEPAEEPASSN